MAWHINALPVERLHDAEDLLHSFVKNRRRDGTSTTMLELTMMSTTY